MKAERSDPTTSTPFAARMSVEQVEEGLALAPKFDADGLIPCITTDANTGEVLMLGYMNGEALQRTIATGEAHYWSRSRQCLWRKGATSGLVQEVVEMRIDDDQGRCLAARPGRRFGRTVCHVGYRSCFYRSVELGGHSDWTCAARVSRSRGNHLIRRDVYGGRAESDAALRGRWNAPNASRRKVRSNRSMMPPGSNCHATSPTRWSICAPQSHVAIKSASSSDTLIAALMTELKTPTFRLRSDLDCRAVQRNPFSRLSRRSKVPKRTSGLSLAV